MFCARWVTYLALQMVRGSIQSHAEFDIFDLKPVRHVSTSFIPALFTAAHNDRFIQPHHARELHAAYAGDKNFIMVEGDHNSSRSKFLLDSVSIFFFNTLQAHGLEPQLAGDVFTRPLPEGFQLRTANEELRFASF